MGLDRSRLEAGGDRRRIAFSIRLANESVEGRK
jgi:hypothetical protein